MEKCKNSPSHWFQAVDLTDGRIALICTHCGEQSAVLPATGQEWPALPVPAYPVILPPVPAWPYAPWSPPSPWWLQPLAVTWSDTSAGISLSGSSE